MPVGTETSVGYALQSGRITFAGGSPTTGPLTRMLMTRYASSSGREVDDGEPEVASGQLYTGNDNTVMAAIPRTGGQGRMRLGTVGHLLNGAGFTAANAGSPNVTTWTPTPASDNWRYITIDERKASGIQRKFIDGRTQRLLIQTRARNNVTFQYQTIHQDCQDSAASHTGMVEISTLRPLHGAKPTTPVVPVQILGVDTAMYDFSFEVNNQFDLDGQPIGQFLLDDLPPVNQLVSIRGVIKVTADLQDRFEFGATGATSVGSLIQNGAFRCRISTAQDAPGAGAGVKAYFEVECSAANFFTDGEIEVLPTRQLYIPFLARCTGTLSVRIMNGGDGLAYLDDVA